MPEIRNMTLNFGSQHPAAHGVLRLVAHIEKRLGIETGSSTPDGRVYLKREEECLAACAGAPMMMVDHKYYENLTPSKIDLVLDGLT